MTRVLVPVAIVEGETISRGLIDLLASMDVTVLGYMEPPDQTSPEQAKDQFEDRAVAALEDFVEDFRDAGGHADYRLVFTPDRKQTVDRFTRETGSVAHAVVGTASGIDRLLVSLSGDVKSDRIVAFVEELIDGRDIEVTLIASGESAKDDRLDRGARRLGDAGISVKTRRRKAKEFDALVESVAGHDAIVMGQKAPSLSSLLFGDEAERMATASVGPVLVVHPEYRESAE